MRALKVLLKRSKYRGDDVAMGVVSLIATVVGLTAPGPPC